MKFISGITALIVICLCFPVFAVNNDMLAGKLEVKYISSRKNSTEYLKFSRYGDKVRLDLNSKIYYIIQIPGGNVWTVNKSKKTVSISQLKKLIGFCPPPLLLFQDIDSIEKYLRNEKVNISFLNNSKSNKIKVVSFKFNNSDYIIYEGNTSYDLADKLEIKNQYSILKIRIVNLKPQYKAKPGDYKIPDNYQVLDLNKLKSGK